MKKLNLSLLILLLSISMIGFTGCKDPEPAHEHEFSDSWSKDGTYHWHAATCEHTTEVSDKAKHTFGDWTTTKEPTEEDEGSREKSCTVCGYTVPEAIEKLEHKHTYSEDWTKDETNHWHVSTCGHEVTDGKATHTFGEWQVTKEASCIENGERKATCTVCDFEKTEVSDKVAHSFGEYVSNNDATTKSDGTKTRTCTVCNYAETVTDEGSKILVPEVVLVNVLLLEETFYMGKYEVTQEEYASVMHGQKVTVNGTEYTLASDPSYCKKDSTSYTLFEGDEQGKRPVEGLTWYDAVWYCNALSEKEGLTPAYDIEVTTVYQISGTTDYYINDAKVTLNEDALGYRLPTSSEWVCAARGGDNTVVDWNYKFSGADTVSGSSVRDTGLDRVGWYKYNNKSGITQESPETEDVSGKGTHQVGKKAPNRLGLYDMSGNVSEFCYEKVYVDLVGGSGKQYLGHRAYGGNWYDDASEAGVVRYTSEGPYSTRYSTFGFRVVCSAVAQ